MDFKIRQATRADVDTAVKWAAIEGWNPGLHDAEVFWHTDPEGFVVMEKDNVMIGSGSIVSYGGDYGFMGFFIVKQEFRGQGLGRQLWYWRRDKLQERLKRGAPIGMDGVFAMQPFYTKGGFRFSHRDLRMEGVVAPQSYSDKVTQINSGDLAPVTGLDLACFGFDRSNFLIRWLSLPDGIGYKYMDNTGLKGYGVIRKCVRGYKIGPLFAADYTVADELFKALSSHAGGEPVYLDIPEINPDAVRLAAGYGLKEMFGCARMYYNQAPKLPYNRIFGVTTFELG